jgi:hypothetical protein
VTGPSRSRQVIDSITQAAQQAEERQPKPVSPAPPPRKVDRSWECLHKPTPMRLHDSDARWLREFAASHAITLDTAGRGLIRAMREAVEQDWVVFSLEQEVEEYEDTLGRQRKRVHTELEADWQILQS